MPRALKFGVFAAAFLSGLFLRGGQGHVMILTASVVAAVPLGLVMGVWLMIGLLKNAEVPILLETFFRGCVMALGCVLLSIASASVGHWLEVREAQAYVASITPQLDDFHLRHRRYPTLLSEIQATAIPARLAYWGEGDDFHFEDRESFFFSARRIFDSRSRQWQRLDS